MLTLMKLLHHPLSIWHHRQSVPGDAVCLGSVVRKLFHLALAASHMHTHNREVTVRPHAPCPWYVDIFV